MRNHASTVLACDFFVVITSSPEPQIDDVRNAYLSYLLDPTAIKYSDLIAKKRGLIDYVQNAGALPEIYKTDFLLLLSKSLSSLFLFVFSGGAVFYPMDTVCCRLITIAAAKYRQLPNGDRPQHIPHPG